jgi:molybdopterin-guanine dinucleotide biosynthesis protein A
MNGLILAGGQSSRMGQPKSLLQYHGKPQYLHLKDLLSEHCAEVFVSCQADQQSWFTEIETILDSEMYGEIGPLNGVLSAFDREKDKAWLVLGCDYPWLEPMDLTQLVQSRNPSGVATVFIHPETRFLEPLLGIYEAAAAPLLRDWLQQGNESLRRFLMQHAVEKVVPERPECLKSVDTPEQMRKG